MKNPTLLMTVAILVAFGLIAARPASAEYDGIAFAMGLGERIASNDTPPADASDDSRPDDDADPDQDAAEVEDETGADAEGATDSISVEDIVIQIDRAPIAMDTPDAVRSLMVRVESDRRLLAELRKQVPHDRLEAELYLKRIRELAAISDPIRLVPMANNVIRQAPALFEWLETEYDDDDERARDYYIGGSWAFHRRFEAFKNAVMLTVINRLDTLAYYVQNNDETRNR